MSFEALDVHTGRPADGPTISISADRVLRLNKHAVAHLRDKLHNPRYARLVWDAETNKLGIQPCPPDPTVYRITYSKVSQAAISGKGWLQTLGWSAPGTVKVFAEWKDGMLQAKLSPEHLAGAPLRRKKARRAAKGGAS